MNQLFDAYRRGLIPDERSYRAHSKALRLDVLAAQGWSEIPISPNLGVRDLDSRFVEIERGGRAVPQSARVAEILRPAFARKDRSAVLQKARVRVE